MKILLLRLGFFVMVTLFSMILGGFLNGRVFSPHGRNIDGMFDALEGVGWGMIVGGAGALIAAIKFDPERLVKANIIALLFLVVELVLLSQINTPSN